jgi:hypothetical protein
MNNSERRYKSPSTFRGTASLENRSYHHRKDNLLLGSLTSQSRNTMKSENPSRTRTCTPLDSISPLPSQMVNGMNGFSEMSSTFLQFGPSIIYDTCAPLDNAEEGESFLRDALNKFGMNTLKIEKQNHLVALTSSANISSNDMEYPNYAKSVITSSDVEEEKEKSGSRRKRKTGAVISLMPLPGDSMDKNEDIVSIKSAPTVLGRPTRNSQRVAINAHSACESGLEFSLAPSDSFNRSGLTNFETARIRAYNSRAKSHMPLDYSNKGQDRKWNYDAKTTSIPEGNHVKQEQHQAHQKECGLSRGSRFRGIFRGKHLERAVVQDVGDVGNKSSTHGKKNVISSLFFNRRRSNDSNMNSHFEAEYRSYKHPLQENTLFHDSSMGETSRSFAYSSSSLSSMPFAPNGVLTTKVDADSYSLRSAPNQRTYRSDQYRRR